MPTIRKAGWTGRTARMALGALLIGVLAAWLFARPLLPFAADVVDGTPLAWALHGVAWASFVAGVGVVAAAWPLPAGDEVSEGDAADAGDEPPADRGGEPADGGPAGR